MRKLTVLMAALAADAGIDETDNKACSVLSDTVYRQVAAGNLGGWRGAVSLTLLPAPAVCRDTARAVSEGFTKALTERDLYITWPTPGQQRGDVCLSHDLTQCYPNQDPFVLPFSLHDAAFVVQQWQAVQAIVSAAMPAGTGSDVSRFDPVAVGHRLHRSLGHEPHAKHGLD